MKTIFVASDAKIRKRGFPFYDEVFEYSFIDIFTTQMHRFHFGKKAHHKNSVKLKKDELEAEINRLRGNEDLRVITNSSFTSYLVERSLKRDIGEEKRFVSFEPIYSVLCNKVPTELTYESRDLIVKPVEDEDDFIKVEVLSDGDEQFPKGHKYSALKADLIPHKEEFIKDIIEIEAPTKPSEYITCLIKNFERTQEILRL